jgi:hypothetical protein
MNLRRHNQEAPETQVFLDDSEPAALRDIFGQPAEEIAGMVCSQSAEACPADNCLLKATYHVTPRTDVVKLHAILIARTRPGH